MKIQLGDTIEFDYSAGNVHDKHPKIFFLARVGNLVHGLNQNYQTPQEKAYFFFTLKKLLYGQLKPGKISAQSFYSSYIRSRLQTDSYRTYKAANVKNVTKASSALWTYSQKIEIPPGKYSTFTKGEHVRFISIVKGRLAWKEGIVLGRKVPGFQYVVKLSDGSTVARHPSDLKHFK